MLNRKNERYAGFKTHHHSFNLKWQPKSLIIEALTIEIFPYFDVDSTMNFFTVIPSGVNKSKAH
jgi:hypothetical protein